ncbi:ComF family protein [Anoxynatronum buryatiense]|uniref:ComF family protein n=1 Tax=Anoxynatronum buryatiense TaxID=489973 RepID=A0AA45WVD8_9CLOT|nr:ComF family protein [Anoxynatronum buryatiense]SMP52455.1 comF family protein [Anoxynatronum buryatiense]
MVPLPEPSGALQKPRWFSRAGQMMSTVLDFIYPPLHPCPGCGLPDVYQKPETIGLCDACYAAFPWTEPHQLPPKVWIPAHYETSARKLVTRLKYHDAQYLVPLMAVAMAAQIRERLEDAAAMEGVSIENWVILPVPLHRQRQRKRGYNQSDLLARHLAFVLEFSYESAGLKRCRPTAPLYRLSRAERQQALAGSMVLNPEAIPKLRGKQLLLVDDIYTTGATINACEQALQAANPISVTVAAFALADLDSHRV